MYRKAHRCRGVVLWAVILSAASSLATASELVQTADHDIDAAARRLAGRILASHSTRHQLPLNSDLEHARTIDPVLTAGAALWIHEALPMPPFTIVGGKIFSYRDLAYDPLEAPVLKIRPIDDEQVIPFLVRILITPDADITSAGSVTVSFPAPAIFEPRLLEVDGWVGSRRTPVSVESKLEEALLTVRVPVASSAIGSPEDLEGSITVIIEGELVLAAYRSISAKRFSDLESANIDHPVAGLARLETGRDIADAGEADQLQSIAATIRADASTPYHRVVAVNSWVGSHLRYEESPATRSAIQALEDRSGDCDEHTTLMTALLRAMAIPARRATGLLYNFDTLSTHAWVEVGLPTRDAAVRWVIVDPTLARNSSFEAEKVDYVQFRDRMLLYPMKPSVSLQGFVGQRTTDILLNWREQALPLFANPSQAINFVDLVTSSVDREISAGAERLAEAGLLLHRQSASIVGSPYVIVDRPVAGQSSNNLQLRLENEERMVLDLTAKEPSRIGAGSIDRLRTVYGDLSNSFFAGIPAHRNLELVYIRDRHSDRLHTVSLRVGRYLVEHHLERILRRLSKAGFLTEEETARLTAVAEASGGKNLYLLQELARRVPAAASR